MEIESSSSLSGDKEDERTIEVGGQLMRYLGPEYISYRKGEGGKLLAYIEGHEVITLMNIIFGWDGWNSKVVNSVTDYAEVSNGGKWSVGIAVTVRLTVLVKGKGSGGTSSSTREVWREDIGYGTMGNGPDRGKATEKCRKEAMTDGLKRAARQLGNATGGCLYNRDYLERIKKVRGPAERIEFRADQLLYKPVNKRKRFMMEQERAQPVDATGDDSEYFFGDDDEYEMETLSGMAESEELIRA